MGEKERALNWSKDCQKSSQLLDELCSFSQSDSMSSSRRIDAISPETNCSPEPWDPKKAPLNNIAGSGRLISQTNPFIFWNQSQEIYCWEFTGWHISLMKTSHWLSSHNYGSCPAAVATYCPGRMAEHLKSKSTGGFHQRHGSPCR